MANRADDKEFRKRIQRIETLIQEVERFPDPAARAHTREIVQAILDLHGAGLEIIFERLAETGEPGFALIDALARDDLVGSLLLLYGLHPLDVDTRVRQALDRVRPSLRAQGAVVELLGMAGGVVRLRLQGSGAGGASPAGALKLAVEEAIYDKAPEVTAIEVEEAFEAPPNGGWAKVSLPVWQK